VFILSACAGTNEEENTENEFNTEKNMKMESNNDDEMDMEEPDEDMDGMDYSGMSHSSSGEVPEGLEEAENKTYEVGSQAIIESDHMTGMNGAEATIVGAYDTTVYTVSYTQTTDGEAIEDHKWVIHEEIEGAGENSFEPGIRSDLKYRSYGRDGRSLSSN